jgi:hypothetical protein
MATIKIELDNEGHSIILSGDTDKIHANRRARNYISDLGGEQSGNAIRVPYEEQTLEKLWD